MTKATEHHYLITLKNIANRGDSIVQEAAERILNEWNSKTTLKEFKEDLTDLKILIDDAEKEDMKELLKIYSVATKLALFLK